MPDRQLLLLRHAKAVTGDPGMEDIGRPLAGRGIAAAHAMGRYMAGHGLVPDLILCSPAQRTRETWAAVAAELAPVEMHVVDALYDFGDGAALLEVIRRHGGAAKRLLLVAHNPATQNLALAMTGSGDKALRRQMIEKYPTAALAVFTLPGAGWAQTAEGQGRLDAFLRPRDLD